MQTISAGTLISRESVQVGTAGWRDCARTTNAGGLDRPEGETWEFWPGSRVRAEWQDFSDGRILVATSTVE